MKKTEKQKMRKRRIEMLSDCLSKINFNKLDKFNKLIFMGLSDCLSEFENIYSNITKYSVRQQSEIELYFFAFDCEARKFSQSIKEVKNG